MNHNQIPNMFVFLFIVGCLTHPMASSGFTQVHWQLWVPCKSLNSFGVSIQLSCNKVKSITAAKVMHRETDDIAGHELHGKMAPVSELKKGVMLMYDDLAACVTCIRL